MTIERRRAKAFTGKGYGTLRFKLFNSAKSHIRRSIASGYYCEAVTIIESIITDRLESRLSFLKHKNVGFRNLGPLIIETINVEKDDQLKSMIAELDEWRKQRNTAIHELVKIEEGKELMGWDERIASVGETAKQGYQLLKRIYRRIADLNPKHTDRVF